MSFVAEEFEQGKGRTASDYIWPGATPRVFSLSVLVPVYNERHLVEASLRRVLALRHELITDLQVIAVDDCSSYGSWDVLRRLAAEDSRIVIARHERNSGKGAAIRTTLQHAAGEICIVHDADLEYHPEDIPSLLLPFAKEGADAVFGSRYLPSLYRRTLMYRHTLLNKFLTTVANFFSDLNLSDMETGYKAINTNLLKSIPLRSNDFRFEVEVTFKLAKRRARIFEVPIRYLPRSYEEGKKIGARDGVRALFAMLHFWLIDDIYHSDEYGSAILVRLEAARKFNLWMGDVLRRYVGDRVLEIGAGIGNLPTNSFPVICTWLPTLTRITCIICDLIHMASRTCTCSKSMPAIPDDFADLHSQFDTVLMINVLEHVPDERVALENVRSALAPGGRAVILVPADPNLYGSLDDVLGHRERYTRASLQKSLENAGFEVEKLFDFNRCAVPGWWVKECSSKFSIRPSRCSDVLIRFGPGRVSA